MNAGMELRRLEVEKSNRRKAGVLTSVIFVAVLILCFFLTAFTMSIPTPGEQFVAVGFADLGDTEQASGDNESETPSETVQEAVQPETAASEIVESTTAEEVVTQESSEVAVPSQPDPVKEPEPKPDPEPTVSSALSNRLNALASSGGGGSQGESQEGSGNEGKDDGRIDGRGVVSGDNGDWSLVDGERIGKPMLDENPRIEGVVRVDIIVDKAGNVTSAIYDGKHSTISDSEHIELALRAARTAKFTPNQAMPLRPGYLNIRFELE
jgi:TonB family protein